LREEKGTVRPVSETMRRLERATVQTYGARYVTDVTPFGWAWLWTFQLMVQTGGSMCGKSPACCTSCVKRAREMGDRAFTGTKPCALEASHCERSFESPPPGTREWMWGWY
jgi:hypothetical protein